MGNNDQSELKERIESSNPFVFDRPVGPSDLFIRRTKASTWVSNIFQNAISRPMRIDGIPGIGQTSFLLQVQTQAKRQGIVPIYVNLNRVPSDSFSEFLWAFGKTVVGCLSDTGVAAPILEKRMLVLRPGQAFQKSFWQPLIEGNGKQRFLLMLDNFERLTTKAATPETNRGYRQYLFELTEQHTNILLLTSLAGRTAAYNPADLAPFHQSINFRITPFTERETYDLLSQNSRLYIQRSTASVIYSLTRGHPADIQRLGYAVFERMKGFGFKVITVADLVSTLRDQLKPADFRQPVHQRSGEIRYPR